MRDRSPSTRSWGTRPRSLRLRRIGRDGEPGAMGGIRQLRVCPEFRLCSRVAQPPGSCFGRFPSANCAEHAPDSNRGRHVYLSNHSGCSGSLGIGPQGRRMARRYFFFTVTCHRARQSNWLSFHHAWIFAGAEDPPVPSPLATLWDLFILRSYRRLALAIPSSRS